MSLQAAATRRIGERPMSNDAMPRERSGTNGQWCSRCRTGQTKIVCSSELGWASGIGYWSLATGSFANIDDAADQLLHTSIAFGGPSTMPAMMAARWDWRLR